VSPEEFASLRDVRRAVRQLPRERRKDVLAAIRAGRAVNDPRDAVLAIAWAERLSKFRWPAWVMPRERPHGKRRWLWLLHLAWVVGAVVVALISSSSSIPGIWRWLVVGVFAYGAIVTPLTMARVLRTYWNAPEAAEKNRQLLARRQ
jgi:hypothetical protein